MHKAAIDDVPPHAEREDHCTGDDCRHGAMGQVAQLENADVWTASAAASNGKVASEPGDLEQGPLTAKAIGEDTLQREAASHVSPERFTHGTSARHVAWLKRGYDSRDPKQCDAFSRKSRRRSAALGQKLLDGLGDLGTGLAVEFLAAAAGEAHMHGAYLTVAADEKCGRPGV